MFIRLIVLLFVSLTFATAFAGCDESSADGDGDGDSDVDSDVEIDGNNDGDSDGDDTTFDIGEVIDVIADTDGVIQVELPTPEGSESYIAVIHSARWDWHPGPIEYDVQLSGGEIQRSSPPSLPAALPEMSLPQRSSPAHLSDLPAILQARTNQAEPLPRCLPLPEPPPLDGEVRTFSVLGDNRVAEIEAEAVRVSSEIAVWLDISSKPPAEILFDDLEEIVTQFEGVILPRERLFFGDESDINEDGLVFILMSEIVHENDGPVAYFYPCDLMEPGTPGCAYSNEAEILYLSPPNAIDPPMNTPRAILETAAHETNHMIFFNTKYLQNEATGDAENMYLLEGYAALAQDLTGYQAGNLFVAWAGLNDILDFSVADVVRDHGAYIATRDGSLRGGAYLFVRYLFDRAGGEQTNSDGTFEDLGGIEFIYEVHNSPTIGLAAVEEALDAPLDEVVFDFYTALAVTNRGPDQGPISDVAHYNYLPTQTDPITERQRGFSAYARLPMGAYMSGPATLPLDQVDGVIRATGVEYVELSASSAGEPLTLLVSGAEEDQLRLRVVRIE